jgi:uncharacterized protein YcbK (DUF882 family)
MKSTYFSAEEFKCKCHGKFCNGFPANPEWQDTNGIDPKLIALLDEVREQAGFPVYITSGYRCPRHNAERGGARQSYHTRTMAADIYCEDLPLPDLLSIVKAAMLRLGYKGGLQDYPDQGFIHVDCRGYWAEWA